jgi:hypothetical protein
MKNSPLTSKLIIKPDRLLVRLRCFDSEPPKKCETIGGYRIDVNQFPLLNKVYSGFNAG